jgi:hypothetical protein
MDGRQIEIRKGPSIGHLWLEPVIIDPEIESQVVALRVERQTESPANNKWQPLVADDQGRQPANDEE